MNFEFETCKFKYGRVEVPLPPVGKVRALSDETTLAYDINKSCTCCKVVP